MRAQGKDIVELFGYRPNDVSDIARETFVKRHCPFTDRTCSKTNHDQSVIYGVCSVTNGMKTGPHDEVIVCPKRLYQKNYGIFEDLAKEVWGDGTELVIGGTTTDLRDRARNKARPAVAFGQNSGTEISVNSNGQMSMDWVIQLYKNELDLAADEFIGIEVQSIDITGNYRDNWAAYGGMKETGNIPNSAIDNSGHGLNWANVHKRLIPQIIRKGNIYRGTERCVGFYFIAPEVVYQKFEEVIGDLPKLDGPARDRLSIKTYSISDPVPDGQIRDICPVRTVHLDAVAVAQAFISNVDENAADLLDERMASIL
ncbi:NotI family restriction endonuclease [Pseudoblastomonas halimionae]|uniref:Restriction endonuclease n=1 Tax=Alteriqipengyuania halimionae TaxID=1926630 RepID=A0A6I4U0Q5_9SPHN|nr:NotI family restriction endonuclease [Alteriqipengyuania halimionae]MXP09609.1 restriction endonuclease [Alteriqipengyuania halimionae]